MIVSQKQAEEARKILDMPSAEGLLYSEEYVKECYREAAKRAHPDKGGTAEAFAAVDRAKHVLLAWLARPQPAAADHKKRACDYCHGEGFLYMPSRQPGSVGLRRTCPKCRGSGDADIDLHNP